MSIEPELIYQDVIFYIDNVPQWSIDEPFSGDLLAGLLVAMNALLDELDRDYEENDKIKSIRILGGVFRERIYFSDYEGLQNLFRKYRVLTNRRDTPMVTMEKNPLRNENYYGLWVSDTLMGGYELYTFARADFIQGFISIMNAFNVDFRNYIFGPPFKYTDEPIFYDVEGYDIAPFPEIKTEAAPTPFYAGAYEADAHAEDYI